MRDGEDFVANLEDGSSNCDFIVDWDASTEDVIKAVDEALKAHGLEIIRHKYTFGGFDAYSIKKVEHPNKSRP